MNSIPASTDLLFGLHTTGRMPSFVGLYKIVFELTDMFPDYEAVVMYDVTDNTCVQTPGLWLVTVKKIRGDKVVWGTKRIDGWQLSDLKRAVEDYMYETRL